MDEGKILSTFAATRFAPLDPPGMRPVANGRTAHNGLGVQCRLPPRVAPKVLAPMLPVLPRSAPILGMRRPVAGSTHTIVRTILPAIQGPGA